MADTSSEKDEMEDLRIIREAVRRNDSLSSLFAKYREAVRVQNDAYQAQNEELHKISSSDLPPEECQKKFGQKMDEFFYGTNRKIQSQRLLAGEAVAKEMLHIIEWLEYLDKKETGERTQ